MFPDGLKNSSLRSSECDYPNVSTTCFYLSVVIEKKPQWVQTFHRYCLNCFLRLIIVGPCKDSCFQFYSKKHTLLSCLNYSHRGCIRNINEKMFKGLVLIILRSTWKGWIQCSCYHTGVKCAWMASSGVINYHPGGVVDLWYLTVAGSRQDFSIAVSVKRHGYWPR